MNDECPVLCRISLHCRYSAWCLGKAEFEKSSACCVHSCCSPYVLKTASVEKGQYLRKKYCGWIESGEDILSPVERAVEESCMQFIEASYSREVTPEKSKGQSQKGKLWPSHEGLNACLFGLWMVAMFLSKGSDSTSSFGAVTWQYWKQEELYWNNLQR